MRVVFFGTPDEAATALVELVDAGHEVALVVTQPDRRRGRGGATAPSPVKAAALEAGLPVVTPERAAEALPEIEASGAGVGAVVAFGQLLPNPVIEAFPHGLVNVHFSLLPRWRGAAPVERAILAGDAETGVCLMEIVEQLDAGAVYARQSVPIGPTATAGALRAELAVIGARLLAGQLDAVPDTTPTPQDGEPTYARKLSVEEFRLDWSAPAAALDRVVRAGNPAPGAWTMAGERRLKVWAARPAAGELAPGSMNEAGEVGTGDGILVLERVQPEGRPAMDASEWLRGAGREVRWLGDSPGPR